MGYRRVASEDRLRIEDGLAAGLSKTAIAAKLGFNKSTITREILRNSGGKGYRPAQAGRLAKERESSKHFPTKLNPILIAQVIERLECSTSSKVPTCSN